MYEIRDKKARENLKRLPFEIKTKEPTSRAMRFGSPLRFFNFLVRDFAFKTGDLSSLSNVDLEVVALCYTLIKEQGNIKLLKKAPHTVDEYNPKKKPDTSPKN